VSISQTAQAAELFLSDGIIVTGAATGSAVDVTAFKGKSNAVVVYIVAVALLGPYFIHAETCYSSYYYLLHFGGVFSPPLFVNSITQKVMSGLSKSGT